MSTEPLQDGQSGAVLENGDLKVTRKQLLQGATVAAIGLAGFPTPVPASALGRDNTVAPSNRITLGVIGTGNQGMGDTRQFLKDERVQVVAVCDVNRESGGYWDGRIGGREPARRLVEETYAVQREGGASASPAASCAAYADFRELLARPDIDAVEIATPDHWHAIPVVLACRAGKDIYCQKPLALTVMEGRRMCNAVEKYGVVFQTGSQQRSDADFRRACELVRNGRIGALKTVRCGLPGGRPDLGRSGNQKTSQTVPDGFDYTNWLGPAPDAPYAPARCHVNFRWIYDYSGGQVTDWGGHHPDCAQWGMGTDHTGPILIRNARAAFPPDPLWNTATEFYFEAVYDHGVTLIISDKERSGVTFEGTEGWVWADRGSHDASSKAILDSEIGPDEIHLYRSDNHFRNFIDRVLDRGECAAPVEVAHRSITICHLGNIAMRLNREQLQWDPLTEQILGDDEAAQMLDRPARHGFEADAMYAGSAA